jgi:hypothetical protein
MNSQLAVEKCLETVHTLSHLHEIQKRRLVKLFVMKTVEAGGEVRVKDPLFSDMVYVAKGRVTVTVNLPIEEQRVDRTSMMTREVELGTGEYFDHTTFKGQIQLVRALEPSLLVTLPYKTYFDYSKD